jgi:iron complex outermembrane receptor protein
VVARVRAASLRRALALLAGVLPLVAAGQPAPAPEGAPPPGTRTPPAPPATPPTELAPVEVTGSRPDDTSERRQSTAAKIVIGREEIERFGDSTLGDVLKRLPGVTMQGRAGRGGAIRLRGLGSGYTQILLDGERVPPGFSLDSIPPDQIERIEILRAPTAETGARAIAGTINIVTRDGYRRRVNDVRLTLARENGALQPSASWTRNVSSGAWTINYSLSAYHFDHDSSGVTTTVDTLPPDGTVTLLQQDSGRVRVRGEGVHATGRLQWRSEGETDTVTLTPIAFYNRGRSQRDGVLVQSIGVDPVPYDTSHGDADYASSLLRLNGQWNHRLGSGGRVETRAGIGQSRQPSDSVRTEQTGGALSRTLVDRKRTRDDSISGSTKLVETLREAHSLVAGAEIEAIRRNDMRTTTQDGAPLLTEFGDTVSASSTRLAAYAQDEWTVTPNWAAHAGLRWEGIATRGTVGVDVPDARNRSSVWSPLLHAVWKPDPKGRDQVRISLTRSYRSPTLAQLIARPAVNLRYPLPGANTPTQPDRAGNPDLRPELATGIDVALERYLAGGGLLSANVFRRDISNYMRNVTTLEDVSYGPVPRYVSRTQNIGKATTQGVELEAKFRLSEWFAEAPGIDVRSNLSFFQSRVREVPGPDNRLDQQPGRTANIGLDYRFRGLPLTLGGNLNHTPGYTTRISAEQIAYLGAKRVFDAYALWVFNPGVQLRLTASNLDPREHAYGGSFDERDATGKAVLRETSRTVEPTFLNVQLRLELKL